LVYLLFGSGTHVPTSSRWPAAVPVQREYMHTKSCTATTPLSFPSSRPWPRSAAICWQCAACTSVQVGTTVVTLPFKTGPYICSFLLFLYTDKPSICARIARHQARSQHQANLSANRYLLDALAILDHTWTMSCATDFSVFCSVAVTHQKEEVRSARRPLSLEHI
jgi:hypothetical protein